MIETGTITKISGKTVKVRIEKKDECSKCGMCLFPKNSNYTEINASANLPVDIGDTVKVESAESGKLLGALLVFGVPLLLIGACILIGYFVFNNELIILLSAVFTCVLWEVVLHFIDKRLLRSAKFTSNVTEVVLKAEDGKTEQSEKEKQ